MCVLAFPRLFSTLSLNLFVVQLVFGVVSFFFFPVRPLSDSMSLSVSLSFVPQAVVYTFSFFWAQIHVQTVAASASTPFVLSNYERRATSSSPGRHLPKAPGDAQARQSPSPCVKVHASEPYGTSKVSELLSPIDTWCWPCARCLPTPLASPLNIENHATY